MITPEKLRELASISRALMPHEMTELANQLEELTRQVASKDRQLNEMDAMVDRARRSLRNQRSVKQIVQEVAVHENSKGSLTRVVDGPFYNVDEVTRIACKLVATENELERLQGVNKELAVETPPRSPEKIIDEIEASVVGRYSFVEIRQLVEHFRKRYPWAPRNSRNNVKEIIDLIKVDDPRPYTLGEMKMMLKWGREQQTAFKELNNRLGRAFADPKAWMDSATGFILKDADKKAMLRAGSISAVNFQEALFSRPSFTKVHEGWLLKGTQCHAGAHFHSHTETGRWWCGTQFSDISGAALIQMLETTLGDLRNLYMQHPQGTDK